MARGVYPYDFPEAFTKALVDRLTTTLTLKVDAINEKITDGNELEAPPAARIFDHIPAIGELRQFPGIGVQELSAGIGDDIGTSYLALGAFVVVAFDYDRDLGNLTGRLRRWESALLATFLANRDLVPAGTADIYMVKLRRTVPGPHLVTADPEGVKVTLSWAGVELDLRREEDL